MGRDRQGADAAEVLRRAREDLVEEEPPTRPPRTHHPAAAERDGRDPRGAAGRQPTRVTRRPAAVTARVGAARRRPARAGSRAVRLREVPGRRRGDAGMAVLPDDAVGARVDQDDAVAVVVVGGDQPVRAAAPRATACRAVGAGGGPERPGHRPRRRDLDDAAGVGEAGDEDSAVREQLRVGGVRDRRAHRVDEPARASSRSIQPPISVTSRPPSGSGVSPFGLEKPRGGSCTQLPPSDPGRPFRAGESRRTRQFLMSATIDVAVRQPVRVVGV